MTDNIKNIIDISLTDSMKSVLDETRNYLDNMKDGDRALQPDIINYVVEKTKVQKSIVSGLVGLIIRSYPGVSMRSGSGGGVFKGTEVKRVDNRPRCETCNQVVRVKVSKTEEQV